MIDKNKIISSVKSLEKKYCDGYFNSNNNNYIAGLTIHIGTADIKLSHPGSRILDEINAFDIAETAENIGANIGQINLIKVSSFCGPAGLLWGYEICADPNERILISKCTSHNKLIPVYDAGFLIDAFKRLVGTVAWPRFPILPGAMVPCAKNELIVQGDKHVYGCFGIGIPENREKNAILFMEDAGTMKDTEIPSEKARIIDLMTKAILEIGKNNQVDYREILIVIKDAHIDKGRIGCVLVAAPYLRLAQDAVPSNIDFAALTIDKWEELVKEEYICAENMLLNKVG